MNMFTGGGRGGAEDWIVYAGAGLFVLVSCFGWCVFTASIILLFPR